MNAAMMDKACRCIERGDYDAPPPRGAHPGEWRQLLDRLARAVTGTGCAGPDLVPQRGADGCPTEQVYCEVPQTITVPAGAAGSVAVPNITTQVEGYLMRLVATSSTAADLDSVKINAIDNLGKKYLPNGGVVAAAYGINASDNALLSGTRITAQNALVLSVERTALTADPVNLTFMIREKR